MIPLPILPKGVQLKAKVNFLTVGMTPNGTLQAPRIGIYLKQIRKIMLRNTADTEQRAWQQPARLPVLIPKFLRLSTGICI